MKILFITNMLPVSDYKYFGIHVKEQIDSLLGTGEVEGEVYFINGRESKLNYIKSIGSIKQKIKVMKPDLIHIHYGISGIFALLTSVNVPMIVTLHSGEIYRKKSWINFFFQKWLTKQVISKVKKVIILNDDMKVTLASYSDKLIKIPCGTNIEEFYQIDGLKGKSNSYIIGFPANKNRPEKNYVFFDKAVELLRPEHDIEIVEFNNMSRETVLKMLNTIDLLCMTSTVEGSPQIIKEAMACNVPIVSSKVGDVDDLLERVSNCFLIKEFNERMFADAINSIFKLPVDERLSDGRAKLKSMRLDSESVSKRLIELYKTCL